MSLTVVLVDKDDFYNRLYRSNITHNLTKMAKEAGIYYVCWRPEELNINEAKDIIETLEKGYEKLKNNPEYFKKFNSSNGWGTYKNFIEWVKNYLDACKKYPNTSVYAGR